MNLTKQNSMGHLLQVASVFLKCDSVFSAFAFDDVLLPRLIPFNENTCEYQILPDMQNLSLVQHNYCVQV